MTLKENGVHSYKVFFFERSKADGGFISPAHYAEQAMSALTTHDMPTLKGFWHCDDLALGRELGLYPDEDVLKTLYADRHQAKQRILDSLHGHGVISGNISHDVNWVGMNTELNHGLQLHMSRGSCACSAPSWRIGWRWTSRSTCRAPVTSTRTGAASCLPIWRIFLPMRRSRRWQAR